MEHNAMDKDLFRQVCLIAFSLVCSIDEAKKRTDLLIKECYPEEAASATEESQQATSLDLRNAHVADYVEYIRQRCPDTEGYAFYALGVTSIWGKYDYNAEKTFTISWTIRGSKRFDALPTYCSYCFSKGIIPLRRNELIEVLQAFGFRRVRLHGFNVLSFPDSFIR